MNLEIFATVHRVMKDINLIDSCQAHLSMQCKSKIEFIARSDTGVMIDSEPHLSRTCKSSLLFSPLTVRVTLVVLLFRFTLKHKR